MSVHKVGKISCIFIIFSSTPSCKVTDWLLKIFFAVHLTCESLSNKSGLDFFVHFLSTVILYYCYWLNTVCAVVVVETYWCWSLILFNFLFVGDRHGPVCLRCVCVESQQPGGHGEDCWVQKLTADCEMGHQK